MLELKLVFSFAVTLFSCNFCFNPFYFKNSFYTVDVFVPFLKSNRSTHPDGCISSRIVSPVFHKKIRSQLSNIKNRLVASWCTNPEIFIFLCQTLYILTVWTHPGGWETSTHLVFQLKTNVWHFYSKLIVNQIKCWTERCNHVL